MNRSGIVGAFAVLVLLYGAKVAWFGCSRVAAVIAIDLIAVLLYCAHKAMHAEETYAEGVTVDGEFIANLPLADSCDCSLRDVQAGKCPHK